jgi:hypothetical protein
MWLNAHRLENKDAHSDQTLFAWLIALIDGIVQHEYYKVMGTISVNYEGPKALVALECFPK